MASVKSHGSYWTVSEGNETAYIIKERASWKEILSIKRTTRLQERTVLRVSKEGLICFSCPSDIDCLHREALVNHLREKFHLDFADPIPDIPGVRFNDSVALQPEHISIRPPISVSANTATIACVADKVRLEHTIRLLLSPISGGPYSIFATEEAGRSTLAQTVRGTVKGLAPGAVYYYVAQIIDEDGRLVEESSEQAFRTVSHSPLTSRIGDLKLTSVTLFGTVDFVSNDQSIFLAWGEVGTGEINIATQANGQNIGGQLIQAEITRLRPATDYWYTIQVSDHDSAAILEESDDRLFTTRNYSVKSRVTKTLATSAKIETRTDYTLQDQEIQIVYGTGTKLVAGGSFKGKDVEGQVVEYALIGLKDDTKYNFKIQIIEAGKVLFETPVSSFKTEDFNIVPHPTHEIKAGTAILSATADWLGRDESLLIIVDDDIVAEERGKERAGQLIKARLIDLKPVTKHQVSFAVASESGIIKETKGEFETKTQNPTALGAVDIKDRTATLMGFIDYLPRQQTARFAWGINPGDHSYYSPNLFGNDSEGQTFSYMAFPLVPETKYYYTIQVIGTDGETVIDESEEVEFTTATQMRARRARDK